MLKNRKWKNSPVTKAVIAACLVIFADLGFAACSNRPETVTLQSANESESELSGMTGSAGAGTGDMARDGDLSAESEGLSGLQEQTMTDEVTGAADSPAATSIPDGENLSASSGAQKTMIYVYVCGAVRSPGVYELEEGTRVYEGVAAAGGFSADADEMAVNQALVLADQDQLYIPTALEMEQFESEGNSSIPIGISRDGGSAGISAAQGTDGQALTGVSSGTGQAAGSSGSGSMDSAVHLVNINTADQTELETLPGIGKTKAGAIIAYRQEKGTFSRIEELKNVSGIGDATFEKLKSLVTVN